MEIYMLSNGKDLLRFNSKKELVLFLMHYNYTRSYIHNHIKSCKPINIGRYTGYSINLVYAY